MFAQKSPSGFLQSPFQGLGGMNFGQNAAFGHPVWPLQKGNAATEGQMTNFYQQVLNRKL
jgi:hypothetical protein